MVHNIIQPIGVPISLKSPVQLAYFNRMSRDSRATGNGNWPILKF